MLLRLENGGKGILTCSQIAAGEENALSIRVYGSKAGLEWHQMEPNTLIFAEHGQPRQVLRTGMPYMSDEAKAVTRLPAGHPEGFLEAFANVYRLAIADIRRAEAGESPAGGYPTVYDGLRGEFTKRRHLDRLLMEQKGDGVREVGRCLTREVFNVILPYSRIDFRLFQ